MPDCLRVAGPRAVSIHIRQSLNAPCLGTHRLRWHNNEHNRCLSIEHNASIIGRKLVYYHKFLLIKYVSQKKDRYTLIEQSENNQTADCSIRVYRPFSVTCILTNENLESVLQQLTVSHKVQIY